MFSRQGVSRWSFQVTAKFISLLTYRLLGYICLSITANVCAIYWMTRKWSWRHRKFHKIRYLGFLKKLTRCEYELSRPSRSRETAADVMRFHFSQIFKFFFMFVLISQCHAELFPRTQKYTNQCQNGFTWKFLIFYLHCWENLQKSAWRPGILSRDQKSGI